MKRFQKERRHKTVRYTSGRHSDQLHRQTITTDRGVLRAARRNAGSYFLSTPGRGPFPHRQLQHSPGHDLPIVNMAPGQQLPVQPRALNINSRRRIIPSHNTKDLPPADRNPHVVKNGTRYLIPCAPWTDRIQPRSRQYIPGRHLPHVVITHQPFHTVVIGPATYLPRPSLGQPWRT